MPASGIWTCCGASSANEGTGRRGTLSRCATASTMTSVRALQDEGCEVGVHGLRHDGRDLGSRRLMEKRLPAMRELRRAVERRRIPVAGYPAGVGIDAPARLRI